MCGSCVVFVLFGDGSGDLVSCLYFYFFWGKEIEMSLCHLYICFIPYLTLQHFVLENCKIMCLGVWARVSLLCHPSWRLYSSVAPFFSDMHSEESSPFLIVKFLWGELFVCIDRNCAYACMQTHTHASLRQYNTDPQEDMYTFTTSHWSGSRGSVLQM